MAAPAFPGKNSPVLFRVMLHWHGDDEPSRTAAGIGCKPSDPPVPMTEGASLFIIFQGGQASAVRGSGRSSGQVAGGKT
jgi:hypothetical protein